MENIEDGKKYALKVLLQKRNTEKDKRDFFHEMKKLEYLNKKNKKFVLTLHDKGGFTTKDNLQRLYFVVDYAEKLDLYLYVKKNGGIGEKYGKLIFKKIVEGIKFCHSVNMCHLDIKVANIILDEKFNPIINDFGLSRIIKLPNKEYKLMTGTRGTKNMMCPQMFEKDVTYNGEDADIFGLGTLLFKLVLGTYGFNRANYLIDLNYKCIKEKKYELFWKVKKITLYNKEISEEFKRLFVKLVAYNPSERPRIGEILKDPSLDEINILEEYYPEKYKQFEKDYISFMSEIEKKIKKENESTVQAGNENENNNVRGNHIQKSMSFNEEEYFNENIKPNKLKENRSYKYTIKIKGNIKPYKKMNSIGNQIIKAYNNKCFIEASKTKLKFEIALPKDDDEEEDEDEEQKMEEGDEDENDRNDRKECIMEIKMLLCGNDEYLLVFNKIQGDLEEFYEHFLIIKDVIKKMFS